MGSLWHPFSDMAVVERDGELVIDRGEGAYVWDADGNRYLDATAGLWFANIGHGRTELADAAATQMRKVAAYSTFGDYVTAPTVELAERLAGIAPVPGSKVFLTSGGIRLDRHRRQAGPPLLGGGRASREDGHHRSAEGVPRDALCGHRDRRHPGHEERREAPPGRRRYVTHS